MIANDVLPQSSAFERFTLTATDGFQLSAMRWLPRSEPRAVLQLSHGMAEYAARYARFAEACIAQGIAVYAHDHRGHGDSIDASTPRGHFADEDGWAKVTGDLFTANAHVHRKHPNLPVFLFGHSMGSFVARAYLLEHATTVAGGILSATGWRQGPLASVARAIARGQGKKLGARTHSHLMTKLVFGTFNLRFRPVRTPFDWLSRDASEVDAYIASPQCGHHCSGTLWADLFGGARAVERLEKDRARPSRETPILLLAGTHDPVSIGGLGHGQLAALYRAAGNTRVTDRRYDKARHELLNETNRAEVTSDIIAWVNALANS
jgi:alpha-beta hydrolase superfamily lysophospholipase